MSHPGQCGWPQILTMALLELSTQTNPAKIFTLSSHRRPCLLLKKQLRTELEFFTLHKILYFIGDTKSTKDSQSLDLTCDHLFNNEPC